MTYLLQNKRLSVYSNVNNQCLGSKGRKHCYDEQIGCQLSSLLKCYPFGCSLRETGTVLQFQSLRSAQITFLSDYSEHSRDVLLIFCCRTLAQLLLGAAKHLSHRPSLDLFPSFIFVSLQPFCSSCGLCVDYQDSSRLIRFSRLSVSTYSSSSQSSFLSQVHSLLASVSL